MVDHLFRRGEIMPSIYLESEGHLRCIAQRGLWQVLDGMPATAGITGRTWKEGLPIVVDRVGDDPDYLEAIPGVVAEICVPISAGNRAIGALNVESLTPFPPRMFDTLIECARLLGRRLDLVRERTRETSWQRASARLHRHLGDSPRRRVHRAFTVLPAGGVRDGLGVARDERGRRAAHPRQWARWAETSSI